MPDEVPQQDILDYAADLPNVAADNGVSRAENLAGAAAEGFGESVVGPLAGLNRLVGTQGRAARLAQIGREIRGPGGAFPTNPSMANDFSTGVARGVGAAPVLALTAEGGLPALVGTGALSGYDAYKQQVEDYEARRAAGQLLPGEEPPSPAKEITKGAIGNAAFLAGGGLAGGLTRRILPSVEGPLARAATAYGGTVAGNLAGEQAARLVEGRPLGFDSPAQAGESAVAATIPFGFRPAQHLLADPRAKFGYKAPVLPERLPEVPDPVDVDPSLSLIPISHQTAQATKTKLPTNEDLGLKVGPNPPVVTEPVRVAPDEIEPYHLRLGRLNGTLEVTKIPESQGGGYLYSPVKQIDPTLHRPRVLPALPIEGLVKDETTAEPTQLAPPTTTTPNETRNDTQQINEPRQGDGTQQPVDQAAYPGEPLGGQVQGPADQANNPADQVRGQGELGQSAPQRPVLAPVPESPQTLLEQQKQLVAGTRPAMLFTPGETPLDLPVGMSSVNTDSGLVHFNPELTSALKVKEAVASGRENEILGLGPENKADVAAAGGTPAVVTERTPGGVEVKAAATSPGKLEETKATLEEQKTPGNTVQVETPGQVIGDRQADNLRQQIGSLDQQLAQARRVGFGPDGKPLPGEEAATARDSLPNLTAQREDLSNDLINLTPEAGPVPQTLSEEAHGQRQTDLNSLLEDARAKLQAQNAIVDSLRPENARKGVDENGNTVEDIGGMSREEREAYNEAKAEAAGLRNHVRFLEQKAKEHADSEPELIHAAEPRQPQDFYSKLERLITSKLQERATGDQIKGLIKSGGIKAEELKWSGIEPWLDAQKGPVSKADVLAYLRGVGSERFVEAKLGGPDFTPQEIEAKKAALDRANQDSGIKFKAFAKAFEDSMVAQGISREAAEAATKTMRIGEMENYRKFAPDEMAAYEAAEQRATRAFDDYQGAVSSGKEGAPRFNRPDLITPGGENYREVVLTMPEDAGRSERIAKLQAEKDKLDNLTSAEMTPEQRARYSELTRTIGDNPPLVKSGTQYTSSHFPNIPDYVAHMRVNDRADSTGKPGTFIEEIQSDRHQQGREKGYKGDEKQTEARIAEITKELQSVKSDPASKETEALYREREELLKSQTQGIPDAPFRQSRDWGVQMFKRALRDAIAQGKDWVGWTTGDTQAERYDLSKQVDKIEWSPNVGQPSDRFDRQVVITPKGGQEIDIWVGKDGKVESADGLPGAEGKHLSDVVGKDVAEKILAGGDAGSLSGEGLRVGGEGMKGFYDKILPNAVGDYVKQWKGKVEAARLPTDKPGQVFQDASSLRWFIDHDGVMDTSRTFKTEAEARAAMENGAGFHKVAITPEMRESVAKEGQPLYAASDKAIEDVAKSRGVAAEPLKAYDQKFQRHFLPQWRERIEKLWGQGVKVTFDDKVDTPGVRPLREGGVELVIPSDWAARVFAAHGREGADARVAEVFREEGIHATVIKALHDEWTKLDPATRPDFYEYNRQVTGKVAGEILATVQGLRDAGRHGEAFAIEQAVRNAKELYDGAVGDSNSQTGRQILEAMQQDPSTAYKYVHEMLRQFAQIRENGQITETTYQKLVGAITELYHKALAAIKGVTDKAFSGEISQTMGDILRRVEEAGKSPSKESRPDFPTRPKMDRAAVTHVEESVIPWHGGADDKDSRTVSRDTPGYSPGQAAADFLSRSHGNGPETLQPHERSVVDLAKLAQFESGRGRLIDRGALLDANPDVIGGGEHQVLYDPKSDRWLKFTRPGAQGLVTEKFKTDIPLPDDLSRLSTRGATPGEYLERMRLANEKFGDDQQYHGVWLDRNGEPGGLVISQPHIEGQDATRSDISKTLTKDGFKRVGIDTWYRPTDRVVLDDATPRNFVTKNGEAQPVDVPLRVADQEVHDEAMRQIASGKRFQQAGERRDLPFAPRNAALPEPELINAPRFLEKAAKSVADKTKEYRYLWGKSYRHFSDSFWRANSAIDTNANNEGIRVTNSILVDIARAGGGKVPKIGEPDAELKRNDAATVILRQAGFGDVTSREEVEAAIAKVADWKTRVDAGVNSPDLEVKEAMEHLKPHVDRAAELLSEDPDGLAKALAWAGKVGQETTRQLAGAAQNGFDVEGIDNYIRQVYEQDAQSKQDQYVPSAGGRGGGLVDKGALKPRYYPDLVTAAEAGKKAVELSASKLVGQGEASLQKLLGQKQLTDELKTVTAPVTNRPVIKTQPSRVFNQELNNGQGGYVERTPEGYVAIDNPMGGKPIYAEKNVAPLFRLLTAASAVRQSSVGRALLQIAAGIKHGTLLFDSYHLIRQAINLAALVAQGGNIKEIRRFVKRGLASLDIRPEDLDKYVREGAITEADAQFARANEAIVKEATHAGVNFGKQLDNLYEEIGKPFWVAMLNHIPRGGTQGGGLGDYITDFNKYTFQKAARAAMIIGYKTARERNAQRFPDWTPEQVARQSAKEVNEIFGNMGKQGIFKSATAQDISRLFILAPQWNDGRFRFQGRAIGNLARGAAKALTGHPEALGNAGGVLLALAGGTFAANQVINLATTGKPTWENPDGHKLDAFVPGGKNGFYYNPLSLAAEDIHTIQKYGANSSPLDVAKRIALNKASGIGRAGAALAGIGPTGRPLPTDQSKLGQAGKSLLPIPIFATPATAPFLQPELSQKGDLIRQGAGMLGIKLDRAESPEQRMRAIANKTFPQNFPKVESPGDYSRLRNFVANDKLSDAKDEIIRLISQGKTEEQIRAIFAPDRKLSNSKQQDALLLRKPDARLLLTGVQKDRAVDFRALQSALTQAKQTQAYRDAIIAGRKAKQPVE